MSYSKVKIFFTFLFGFALGSLLRFGYEAAVFKAYSWTIYPKILNCYGDDFHVSYITEAVAYWHAKGERIDSIVLNPSEEQCSNKYLNKHIIIRKAYSGQLNSKILAVTDRHTQGIDMLAASIYFNPGNFRLKYLATHELGHAFGYGHVEIEGHIMNPLYDNMGPNFWIP